MSSPDEQRDKPGSDVTGPAGEADRRHALVARRPDFARHFQDNGIAFQCLWNSAFRFGGFLREHDLQARRLPVLEHRDVNTDDARSREQRFVVRAEDLVDVAPRSR